MGLSSLHLVTIMPHGDTWRICVYTCTPGCLRGPFSKLGSQEDAPDLA